MATKVGGFYNQYANEINFTDTNQITQLAVIVKTNIDIFKELATTYQNQNVKLSVCKETKLFVVDTNYLYTRNIAGYLPDFMRWNDSNIAHVYSFFELLIMRIHIIGKYKINDEEGSLARYFRVHKKDLKNGLETLIKTYEKEGTTQKKAHIDLLNECKNMLDPLDKIFDILYQPMNEYVKSAHTHLHLYLEQCGEIEDVLKLDQFKEIHKFIMNMNMAVGDSFPKRRFIITCLQMGVDKSSKALRGLNSTMDEITLGDSCSILSTHQICLKLIENEDFKPVHLLILASICKRTIKDLTLPLRPLIDAENYIVKQISAIKSSGGVEHQRFILKRYWESISDAFGYDTEALHSFNKLICFLYTPHNTKKDPDTPPLPFADIGYVEVEDFVVNVLIKFDCFRKIDTNNAIDRTKLIECAEKIIENGFKHKKIQDLDSVKNWVMKYPSILELSSFKSIKAEVQNTQFENEDQRIAFICQKLSSLKVAF